MRKTIEVTFSPDGKFTVEAHGFNGSSCHADTKAFEEALGEVQTRRRKAEFYQVEPNKNQQKIGE
jgi:hypothetical protein